MNRVILNYHFSITRIMAMFSNHFINTISMIPLCKLFNFYFLLLPGKVILASASLASSNFLTKNGSLA
jgi:hypothetical protein